MKLTFRTRLYAGFSLVVAIFLCVIGITVWQVEQVKTDTRDMKNEALMLDLANQWLADVRQNSARSLAVARSPGKDMFLFFKDAMAAVSAGTTKTQKAFLEAVERLVHTSPIGGHIHYDAASGLSKSEIPLIIQKIGDDGDGVHTTQ